MPDFFDKYEGESTEQLIALELSYRTDSLVLAFEQAILRKPDHSMLSREERLVLAVEALEREVNNGGYDQFFLNTPEFVPAIVEALLEIGCPLTAEITSGAIAVHAASDPDSDAGFEELGGWDARYYASVEPIADNLFEWIKRNRGAIRIGAGGS